MPRHHHHQQLTHRSHASRADRDSSPPRVTRVNLYEYRAPDIGDRSSEEDDHARNYDYYSNDRVSERTIRDVNRMGGLGAAAEEVFMNAPAREAERRRLEEHERALRSDFPTEERCIHTGRSDRRHRRCHHFDDQRVRPEDREERHTSIANHGDAYRPTRHRGYDGRADAHADFSDTDSNSNVPTTSRHYHGHGDHVHGRGLDGGYHDASAPPQRYRDGSTIAPYLDYDGEYESPDTPMTGRRMGWTGHDEYDDC